MNAVARPWIGLCFKMLAVLALIFAFIFFMRMQEEQSLVDRYRAEGTVSHAVITGKDTDTIVYEGRRGRSRTEQWRMLWVRFDPESTVRYSDFAAAGFAGDLPSPPEETGDALIDSDSAEIISVPADVYEARRIGEQLVVVDTIYSGDGPLFIDDIRYFEPSSYYPGIVISLLMTLIFGVIGWRISRASALRGAITAGPLPTSTP